MKDAAPGTLIFRRLRLENWRNFTQVDVICEADLQVCAGPPGPAFCTEKSAATGREQAGVDTGCRTGVLPHKMLEFVQDH
jgi:hypothetical protein